MSLDDRARALLEQHVRRIGVREIGRRAGIAGPNLSAWLGGRVNLPLARLEAIAAAVGRRLDVVLRRAAR